MLRSFLVCTALLLAASCATVSRLTIENRLVDLGLSSDRASCMADELAARLDDRQLTELARHAVTLTRADGPAEIVSALAGIDDFAIARSVTSSGLACLLSRR